MSKFCENCGAKLADDAKFCEECGTKILPMSQVPPQFDHNQQPGNTGSFGNGSQYPKQNYQTPEQGAQQPNPYNNFNPGNVQNQGYGDSAPGAQQPGSFNNFNQNGAPNRGYSGFDQQQNQFNNLNGMQNPGYGNSEQQPEQFNNQNNAPNQGYAPAPGGQKKSGIPKVAIIGGVALVAVAAVGAFLVLGKLKGGQNEDESVAEETYVDYDQSSTQTTAGVESDTPTSGGNGGISAREQATALDAALSIAGGMVDASQLKIPEGATIKTDAEFVDLIGEYEGEIQMTTMSGFEGIEGAPANILELEQQVLDAPIPCTLEIEGDGQWSIKWEFMGSMNFESRDYDDPEEVTPAQIAALMASRPNNGVYHMSFDMEGDDDKGGTATMKMSHTGAYCTDGTDRLIAGNQMMSATMYGAQIDIQGDFVVHKTTEDVAREELEASKRNYDSYQEDTKEEDTEQEVSSTDTVNTAMIGRKAKEIAGNKSDSSDNSDSSHKSDSSDNSRNQKAESNQEIPTVTGGKWKQVAATWFYEKNDKIVKNSWIETDGVYYYVDEDGYMLEDAYTPDGYYVGPDGAYDPKDPKNKGVSGSSSESSKSSSDDEEFLPSTFAKKAKKDILQDGTVMYMNSVGDYVANVWVQDSDNGKYYYTGPDGCMIKDNYSADGYWCGSDGEWDKSVKQRNEDPEPKTGTYVGFVATWKVKITKDSKYGTATHTYTEFGGTPQVYDLTPVGHGVYIAEDEYGTIAYMSVTDNGKTLIVSEAGITEECTLK